MNKKWIKRTSHISQWTGSFVHRRTRYWELVRLLEVREGEGGGREFLVQWAGEDRNGDPWPNDWQPEKNVTADAIREFEFSCAVMNDLQLNGLDVRPLLSLARKKIASALLACKQKEIASMHNIPLDFLAHEKLCRAFFALAARPKVLPNFTAKKSRVDRMAASVLDVEETEDFIQLNMTSIEDVAWFCSLQQHLGKEKAKGLLRFDFGRTYNSDLQAVGLPLSLTAKKDKGIDGIVAVSLKFPSVHFLGKFGTPEPPPMKRGWLKSEANLRKLVAHVRRVLPSTHELAEKGWTRLPRNVYSLPKEVAVPDE